MKIKLFLFLLGWLIVLPFLNEVNAQPANDSCVHALLIPVGMSCSLDTFDSAGATAEALSVVANPGCGFYKGGDVWFKVVVPVSGNIRFEVNNIGMMAQFAVYEGQCGNFNKLSCNQLDKYRTLSDTALAGDTLYLRVYRYNSSSGGTFSFCAWEPQVPVNNNCENATYVPAGMVCQVDTFTNAYSTQEDTVAPKPTCGFYEGGDVWFKTVMPSSGAIRVEVDGIGSNPQFELYEGSCGLFQKIVCNQLDKDRTWVDTSLIGDTITIRVYSYGNREGGPFSFCIWEPEVPSNDDCTHAIYLAVDTLISMRMMCDTFSSRYATTEHDSIAPDPTCGFYEGGDVWFKTVFPASGYLQMEIEGGNNQFALYSGRCGSMVQVNCVTLDPVRTFQDASLGGDTVYVRVFNYGSPEGTEFSLKLMDPVFPANDFCANAIALTPGNHVYSNFAATNDSVATAPNPTCGAYKGGDVWFTYLVPASGEVKIKGVNLNAGITPMMQLYSGTCGSMTRIICAAGGAPLIEFTDSSLIGETLYLRVYKSNRADGGTFGICAFDKTCKSSTSYAKDRFMCKCEKIDLFPHQFLTINNTYTEAYKTASGDDSVLVFTLKEAPAYNVIETDTVCFGASYVFPDAFSVSDITATVTHTSFLKSIYDCDSTVHTTVTVRVENMNVLTDDLCSGGTYYFPDGDSAVNVTAALSDTSIFIGTNGCDSLVVVNLSVNPTHLMQLHDSVCSGSRYVFPDGDTLFNITAAHTDSSYLATALSCDSLLVTTIFVHPTYTQSVNDTVCKGVSYLFPDGLSYVADSSTTHVSLLTTTIGCDSLITTQLEVVSVDTSVSSNANQLIANRMEADGYQWLDCDNNLSAIVGETNRVFNALTSTGVYAVEVTENQCIDTSFCHVLLGVGIEEYSASGVRIYPNPANDLLYIVMEDQPGMVSMRLFSLDQKLVKQWELNAAPIIALNITSVPPGVYLLELHTTSSHITTKVVKH
jgi:hypothetical protein